MANLATKSSLQRSWFMITSLVSKDFKLKYRRSVLGVLWSVLNPLLMMIVLTAVFSFVFKFSIENFAVYLILGQTVFNYMSGATTECMYSIISSASLIKKIKIDKIIFPIEKALFGLVNSAISLIAVAIVMIYFQIVPGLNLLWLPFLIITLFFFSLGLGLILATLAVFFRDFLHLWGVLTTAWMYATPVIYPVSILEPWMMQIMQFNPMYYYVDFFRNIVMYNQCPEPMQFAVCALCAIIAMVIGLIVFRRQQGKFILYV
jgi:ABC-2 type transport system permease protein